jgi:hexokinase
MYLGEIVRRVLAKMAQESDLFGHSFGDKLAEPFVLRQVLHVPASKI